MACALRAHAGLLVLSQDGEAWASPGGGEGIHCCRLPLSTRWLSEQRQEHLSKGKS